MPGFGVWEYLIFLIVVLTVLGYVAISVNKKRAATTRRARKMGVRSWVLVVVVLVVYYVVVYPVMGNVTRFLMEQGLLVPVLLLCLGFLALCVWLALRNAGRRVQERMDARTWVPLFALLLAGEFVLKPRAGSASQFLADRRLLLPAFVLCLGATMLWALYRHWHSRLREQERVDAVKGKLAVWGDAICEHLIQIGQAVDAADIQPVLEHVATWGQELCLDLLRGNVGIGMTEEMIRASLGEPDIVDNEDVSASGIAYRWVYRIPGRGPMCMWFRDDKVVRIRR